MFYGICGLFRGIGFIVIGVKLFEVSAILGVPFILWGLLCTIIGAIVVIPSFENITKGTHDPQ